MRGTGRAAAHRPAFGVCARTIQQARDEAGAAATGAGVLQAEITDLQDEIAVAEKEITALTAQRALAAADESGTAFRAEAKTAMPRSKGSGTVPGAVF